MGSRIQEIVNEQKSLRGDKFVEMLVDITFVTSYRIEDLIKMPPSRLKLLIEGYQRRFCK